jgi:hypothetical protein
MTTRRRLLASAGAIAAAASTSNAAARSAPKDADTLYGHGMVWNRDLPGLAGRLNLAFDLRVNLATGAGAGSASDAVFPSENFHFAITHAVRERVQDEDRFVLAGVFTDAANSAYLHQPVRIAAQTQGDTTAVVIRVGDRVYMGAGLVVIAIIAILIGLLLPAVQ